MGKVRGEDVVVYIEDVANGKCNDIIGCSRSITFDIQQDMIETSITGNGRFRTYVPGAGSVTATLEGLVGISSTYIKSLNCLLSFYGSPPLNALFIDVEDICLPVGNSMTMTGTGTADGTYTIASFAPYPGGSLIGFEETIPYFDDVNGQLTWDEPQYSIERMYESLISGSKLLFEFYETDTEGHFLRKTFYGYIQSISEIASFDNIATYTANITATGLPIIEYG